ncbi:hypothetical protein KP509_37G043900 [Ceratopteris richardii]|uniref:Uncharacterized protein n=1 Tax=Ceratopteris richardii TaxID=49495 RepID=A0A8T2Q8F9_CERRI|nr:hypothetical protein KP509_37G043900 [Ceratopteris richardii]
MVMGADADPSSPSLASPYLRRQRSLASAFPGQCCGMLCSSHHRHDFFMRLPPPPSSLPHGLPRVLSLRQQPKQQHRKQSVPWHENWKLLGSRRSRVSAPPDDEDEWAVTEDVTLPKPGRWRRFLRRFKEGTKRMNCTKPPSSGFQYDAFSYAMNFDDCTCKQQQLVQHSSYRLKPPRFLEPLSVTGVGICAYAS